MDIGLTRGMRFCLFQFCCRQGDVGMDTMSSRAQAGHCVDVHAAAATMSSRAQAGHCVDVHAATTTMSSRAHANQGVLA
jgi:hypothetical protein